MGQPLSITLSSRRKTRKFLSSQIFANGNNNLSHTFAIFDDEPPADLINVNRASENELLKVRDIDLELAKNIIKHRKAIGYFQKVEDLVVVPGMGADKLQKVRHFVCVNTKNVMRFSSQSFDSLKSVDSRTTISKTPKPVNVNVASVYDLQLVHGMTQEIAAAIVYYRSKRGPFKKLEDLRKIKCIDCIRLDNISRYLTVDNEEDISDQDSDRQSYSLTLNGNTLTNNSLSYSCRNGTTSALFESTLADIFELLSAYSPRPIVKELFKYSRNDKPAFRVSSWDLDNFSTEKALNLGVREVVCRTILENGWSIVAVQNLQDKNALKIICDELNEPKLQRVKEWKINRNCWQYCTNDNSDLGFIYDASGVDKISGIFPEKYSFYTNPMCNCLAAYFKIGEIEVQILNLIPKVDPGAQCYLQKLMNTEIHTLICGDFGSFHGTTDFFGNFDNSRLVFPVNLSNSFHFTTNTTKHRYFNFLVNKKFERYLTGLHGVLRNGLTHLAIPSGWTWGGPVSSTCPVWVEFFATPN